MQVSKGELPDAVGLLEIVCQCGSPHWGQTLHYQHGVVPRCMPLERGGGLSQC